MVKQTVDYTNIPAIAISALSSSSGSLTMGQSNFTYQQEVWAVKADAKAAIKYTLSKMTLPFSDGATLNAAPTLPVQGKMGANISWKSSDTSILTDEGKVKGKGKVTLTMTISKDDYEYVKDYTLNIDADAEKSTPVYYPVSEQKNTTNVYAANLSQDYTVKAGNKAQFKFYNYTVGTDNYKSWVLGVSNVAHGATGYKEYVMLRNDNWENIAWNNTGCTSDFNWDTFVQDMNGSLVDMTVEYAATGAFKMTALITTKDKKVYHYSYSKTISGKPAKINVFFTGENSYIDGSSLVDTGIASPIIFQKKTDGKWYNLAGQQVDKSYKGVVVVNGRKFVNK